MTKNDLGEEAQPSIKIGNIDSGTTDAITAGAVSVTPGKIYRGDEVDFKISFKAAGPIYDIDSDNDGTLNVDAQIVIDLGEALDVLRTLVDPLPKKVFVVPGTPGTLVGPTVTDAIEVDLDPPPATSDTQVSRLSSTSPAVLVSDSVPQKADRRKSAFVSITKRSGVVLGNPALTLLGSSGDEEVTANAQRVRINIVNMDKDEVLELTYKKVWAASVTGTTETLADVEVTSDANPASASVGSVIGRPGTGTIEITDTAVQINTPESFDIKYTAVTAIADAYLAVKLPLAPSNPFMMPNVNDDTQLTALTLTDANFPDPADITVDLPHPNGDNPRSRYGRVESLRVSHNSRDVTQTVTADTIVWGPLTLPAKGTLTAKINNVRITDQTSAYLWEATLVFMADRPVGLATENKLEAPTLYVLQADANPTDPDVTFEISESKALPLSTLGSASVISTAGTRWLWFLRCRGVGTG